MAGQPEFETKIYEAADTFAQTINQLATRTYIREGILRQSVTAVIWALFNEMDDTREALADVLEDWPKIIQDADDQDRRQRGED